MLDQYRTSTPHMCISHMAVEATHGHVLYSAPLSSLASSCITASSTTTHGCVASTPPAAFPAGNALCRTPFLCLHITSAAAARPLHLLFLQGAEAAGEVPADLGEPDEHGVYTHSGATGTIYFRQCQHCGSGGISSWEFSTDRAFWIPACHVSACAAAAAAAAAIDSRSCERSSGRCRRA